MANYHPWLLRQLARALHKNERLDSIQTDMINNMTTTDLNILLHLGDRLVELERIRPTEPERIKTPTKPEFTPLAPLKFIP